MSNIPTNTPDLNDPKTLDHELKAPKEPLEISAPTRIDRMHAVLQIKSIRYFTIGFIAVALVVCLLFIFVFAKDVPAVDSTISPAPDESSQIQEFSPEEVPAPSPANDTPVTQPATPPTNASCASGVDVPAGVCSAIDSIEKNGAKNNEYVVANTSGLPDGTKITIDRASWQQTAPEFGKTSGKVSYGGKTYDGVIFFNLQREKWVVTSYELQ